MRAHREHCRTEFGWSGVTDGPGPGSFGHRCIRKGRGNPFGLPRSWIVDQALAAKAGPSRAGSRTGSMA